MLHGSGLPYCAFCSVGAKNVLNNICGRAGAGALPHHHRMRLSGYEIQAAATIGRRFTIHHGYAVVINKTSCGDDFTIRHGITIGNRGPDMSCRAQVTVMR